MNVAILEDEVPARALLVRSLAALRPTWKVVAELESLAEARAWSGRAHVDLVLSDIRLADGSALTLFDEGVVTAPVIFVTAWDSYVVAAFAHFSIDYVLKPLSRDALETALTKFERFRQHFAAPQAHEAAQLVGASPRRRVLVRYKTQTRVLPVEDVAYFRAHDKLTLAVDATGNDFVIDRSLGQLERELDATQFFRANRTWLVHVSAVVGFRSAGRGRLALSLVPSPVEEVVVSQENAEAFRRFIDR